LFVSLVRSGLLRYILFSSVLSFLFFSFCGQRRWWQVAARRAGEQAGIGERRAWIGNARVTVSLARSLAAWFLLGSWFGSLFVDWLKLEI
jgi:hypothetical protein